MAEPAVLVVLGAVALAMLLAWGYFRHIQLTRPPIGVINLWDISLLVGGIILTPLLYQLLPRAVVAVLLGLMAVSVLYLTLEPVLRARWAVWLSALGLAGADVAAALTLGGEHPAFFALNNVLLVLVAVGIVNVWAQSGLRARALTILAAFLVVYDLLATTWLPLTSDLLTRLAGLPFMPMLGWPLAGDERWLALGLGDLLVMTACPIVWRKAFGRTAGRQMLLLLLASTASLLVLVASGTIRTALPVMVVLGPLIILSYAGWTRRHGPERTTWQYRQHEAPPAPAPGD